MFPDRRKIYSCIWAGFAELDTGPSFVLYDKIVYAKDEKDAEEIFLVIYRDKQYPNIYASGPGVVNIIRVTEFKPCNARF